MTARLRSLPRCVVSLIKIPFGLDRSTRRHEAAQEQIGPRLDFGLEVDIEGYIAFESPVPMQLASGLETLSFFFEND